MNAADADKSPRLQKMLQILKFHPSGLTTLELQSWTNSCAVHSDISELRQNGYRIERKREANRNGRQIHRYLYRGRP
jgi:hypothetical protein